MTASTKGSRLKAAARSVIVSTLGLVLWGCVADEQQGKTQSRQELAHAQPRQMVYDCGDDGHITVHAAPTAVRLIEPDGESYDLPASPPTQNSRYGQGGMALVVEGGEALWMKAGRSPMTCKR